MKPIYILLGLIIGMLLGVSIALRSLLNNRECIPEATEYYLILDGDSCEVVSRNGDSATVHADSLEEYLIKDNE